MPIGMKTRPSCPFLFFEQKGPTLFTGLNQVMHSNAITKMGGIFIESIRSTKKTGR